MRIAVIADIHGNDLALEAVLADIAAQSVDDVVNLGDHLSGALNAARTADILMRHRFPSVRGNHDRWLVEKAPEKMGSWDSMAHQQLKPHHFDWLKSLPPTLVHRGEIFLCHATPVDDTTYWLDEATPDGTMRLSQLERIEKFAEGIDHPVLLCGHTHLPRIVRLRDGRIVLNPGSVGCPGYDDDEPVFHKVETGSPHARYAIIEKTGSTWNAEFRLVSYDHMAASRLAASRGQREWANVLARGWLG
ncbi:metallophosphoesterase family protein [Sinorhizobium sp. BG8]|uniref:metallophosphoesterase family protein n=1 Tax=Sinorhizobium sp. BG8 TaxID=2613773 RepID=UPI00193CBF41|nr:metallophosphoesterase family protein [Sinorhizobium sp. BG8]QRM56877.1 metallophosphoesterase family protein [Sinorhizobium sp. BG8]